MIISRSRLLSAQRYWGVLDILAIDCEATAANRQLAQEYAISGFPTFVLMHKGRRVDQVCKTCKPCKDVPHVARV